MPDSPISAASPPHPALSHSDALPAGAVLAEFEVTGLLGVGGFGMVYSAFDRSLQRTVAIKEFMPSALAGRSSGLSLTCRSSADQDAMNAGLKSFVAEARMLAQFDHPSLVKVYRFWEANNTAYMVMPMYRGMTLKEARGHMQSPPPEPWLRTVLWSILGALNYLHEHKVVHRDISPDNIFLQDVGPPVLLDLGAARRAISDKSQKHTAVLKVNYAPIEQYADSGDLAQGPWTDLYSLAAVVHGCLCNAPPMPATVRAVRDRLPGFASVAKTVQALYGQAYSKEFVLAFGHALAVHPSKRPQTVQAFIDEWHLTAPDSAQALSWRDCLVVPQAGDLASVDPHAKTVLQTAPAPDQAIEAPATDSTPLELVSAYGVLEQESPLLKAATLADVPPAAAVRAPVPKPEPDTLAPVASVPSSARPKPGRSGKPRKSEKSGKSARPWVAAFAGVALVAALAFWFTTMPDAGPAGRAGPVAPAASPSASSSIASSPPSMPPPSASPVTAANPVSASATPLPAGAQPVTVGNLEQAAAPARPGVAAGGRPKVSEPQGTKVPAQMRPPAAANAARNAPGIGSGSAAGSVSSSVSSGTTASSPAELPANAQASPSAPDARAETARPSPANRDKAGPVEICANRNFLVRSMCVFQECEKPEFTHLPFCVENRRQLAEKNARP